jgi:GNAT superfamily N-acetyltransferase
MPGVVVDKRDSVMQRAVRKGLIAFNRTTPNYTLGHPLSVSLIDDGEIVGGATGDVRGPTLYVDLLWVADAYRGQDFGTKIMDLMEDEARRRGATQAYLDTYSFQAKPFYEKRGYAVIGKLEGFLEGIDKYWLAKSLG